MLMKVLNTIPVYNRKGQRVTSITEQECLALDLVKVDEQFFIVEQKFIVVKSKFFRHEHLVNSRTFLLKHQDLHFKKQEGIRYKKVFFLLEAPHRNEYDYAQNFKGKSPLFGKLETFRTAFNELINEIEKDENIGYEITLYNAVPFLTSLHYLAQKSLKSTTKFNFWLYGWWNLKYHKELEEYLELHKFDYYFNASAKQFKSLISRKLSNLVPTEYQVHHPSSGFWNRKIVNFGLKKIVHLDNKHELFQNNTINKAEEVF